MRFPTLFSPQRTKSRTAASTTSPPTTTPTPALHIPTPPPSYHTNSSSSNTTLHGVKDTTNTQKPEAIRPNNADLEEIALSPPGRLARTYTLDASAPGYVRSLCGARVLSPFASKRVVQQQRDVEMANLDGLAAGAAAAPTTTTTTTNATGAAPGRRVEARKKRAGKIAAGVVVATMLVAVAAVVWFVLRDARGMCVDGGVDADCVGRGERRGQFGMGEEG